MTGVNFVAPEINIKKNLEDNKQRVNVKFLPRGSTEVFVLEINIIRVTGGHLDVRVLFLHNGSPEKEDVG